MGGDGRRGQGGDRKAPLSRPQTRNPCVRESASMVARPAIRSRPSGATQHSRSKEQLGGASEDAQSYWQGRFAACAFVGGFLEIERPKNSWGVAPNPTRELRPLTRKGHCPLTLFLRPGLSALHSVIAIEAIIAPNVFAKRIVTRTAPDTSPSRNLLISTGATSKISPSADATIPTNIPPTTIAATPNTPGRPSVHRSALCSAASINPLSSANPIIRGDAACSRC